MGEANCGGVLPIHSREHVNTNLEEEERKKNVSALKKDIKPCPFVPHHSRCTNFKSKQSHSFRSFPQLWWAHYVLDTVLELRLQNYIGSSPHP